MNDINHKLRLDTVATWNASSDEHNQRCSLGWGERVELLYEVANFHD